MANILSIAASFNASLTARVNSIDSTADSSADSQVDRVNPQELQRKTSNSSGIIMKRRSSKSLEKMCKPQTNQKWAQNMPKTTMNGITPVSKTNRSEIIEKQNSTDYWFSFDERDEIKNQGEENLGYDSLDEKETDSSPLDRQQNGNQNKTPIKLLGRQGSGESNHQGISTEDDLYSLPMERMEGVGDENPHFSTYM